MPHESPDVPRRRDIQAVRKSAAVAKTSEGQVNSLGNYIWEKDKEYVGEQDYEKKMFNLASNGRFYINFLYGEKGWKEDFIKDFLKPNIKQAEFLVSIIDGVYKE